MMRQLTIIRPRSAVPSLSGRTVMLSNVELQAQKHGVRPKSRTIYNYTNTFNCGEIDCWEREDSDDGGVAFTRSSHVLGPARSSGRSNLPSQRTLLGLRFLSPDTGLCIRKSDTMFQTNGEDIDMQAELHNSKRERVRKRQSSHDVEGKYHSNHNRSRSAPTEKKHVRQSAPILPTLSSDPPNAFPAKRTNTSRMIRRQLDFRDFTRKNEYSTNKGLELLDDADDAVDFSYTRDLENELSCSDGSSSSNSNISDVVYSSATESDDDWRSQLWHERQSGDNLNTGSIVPNTLLNSRTTSGRCHAPCLENNHSDITEDVVLAQPGLASSFAVNGPFAVGEESQSSNGCFVVQSIHDDIIDWDTKGSFLTKKGHQQLTNSRRKLPANKDVPLVNRDVVLTVDEAADTEEWRTSDEWYDRESSSSPEIGVAEIHNKSFEHENQNEPILAEECSMQNDNGFNLFEIKCNESGILSGTNVDTTVLLSDQSNCGASANTTDLRVTDMIECELCLSSSEDDGLFGSSSSEKVAKDSDALKCWEIDHVSLDRSAVDRLSPGGFLDDSLLDFFFRFIQKHVLTSKQQESIYFFNCFFFQKLSSQNSDIQRYEAVKSWTKTLATCGRHIWKFDHVFIPVNNNTHWYMLLVSFPGCAIVTKKPTISTYEIDPLLLALSGAPTECTEAVEKSTLSSSSNLTKPTVACLDSLKEGRPFDLVKEYIVRYMQMEFEERKSQDYSTCVMADVNEWHFIPHADLPHQQNGYDCGVFVIEYTLHLCLKEDSFDELLHQVGIPVKQHRNTGRKSEHSKPDVKPKWFDQRTVSHRRKMLVAMLEYMREHPQWESSESHICSLKEMLISKPEVKLSPHQRQETRRS